jgi:hypothetical protein
MTAAALGQLLQAAADNLGRAAVPDHELQRYVTALNDNWFDTPESLRSATSEQCVAMNIPSRLILEAKALADAQQDGDSGDEGLGGGGAGGAATSAATAVATPVQLAAAGGGVVDLSAGLADGKGGADGDAAVGSFCFGDDSARAPPRRRGRKSQRGAAGADGGEAADRPALAHGSAKHVRLTSRRKLSPYRLSQAQQSAEIAAELSRLERFLTTRFLGQQEARVAPVTARKYVDIARGALGWLHLERGVPLAALTLASLFPDSSRASVGQSFEHVQWLVDARGASSATEATAIRGLVSGESCCLAVLLTLPAHPCPGDGEWRALPCLPVLLTHPRTGERGPNRAGSPTMKHGTLAPSAPSSPSITPSIALLPFLQRCRWPSSCSTPTRAQTPPRETSPTRMWAWWWSCANWPTTQR